MIDFPDSGFSGLRDAFLRNRQEKSLSDSRAAAVLNTIESVVDGTDSKIRLVHGYRKKLGNIIQSSLEFSDDIVNRIPSPLEVSSSTFVSDPHVNAFFTNVADLQSVFSHSSEIQDYMAEPHEDSAGCCALLCMRRTEKTVMGMELSGDRLNKDVLQVAVNFSDHRIYSPAPNEPKARHGLKQCLFQGLVTNTLERIMKLRLASHRLQNKQQMLHARLRRNRQKIKKIKQDTGTDNNLAHAIEATGLELREVEEQMLNTPLMTPQALLEQVVDVFSNPGEFIKMRKIPLRLNKMCIKISNDSPAPANQLNLTEVVIGNELPRVVTLARFPEKDLLASKLSPTFQHPGSAAT
ncbi:MAG: hypothetical protein OEV12_07560 [Gammaproteobacteria bacterium]|jgi:hypothetical protein|nr:hypothetical protein [Gammaproteobacteria bacterium]MDH3934780.1 hypothetical protein [Gammaproteobacteria bacterium]MDH3986252.1 hypothetical protein [Gammaproteobacteria bacterium]